jgi:hypothetical protein
MCLDSFKIWAPLSAASIPAQAGTPQWTSRMNFSNIQHSHNVRL